MVLMRALQLADFDVRLVQLNVRGVPGGHIVVSAELEGRWVVLDPLFDLAFVDPLGRLAEVSDLREDWERYSKQVPDRYDLAYDYQAVTYTNWHKVPVVMPALRSGLAAIRGADYAATFSLRAHVLNVYRVYALGLALLYLPVVVATLVTIRRGFRR